MRFAFYVSHKATRLIKTIEKLNDNKSDLLKDIAFILNDNPPNPPLKKICDTSGIEVAEVDLSKIEKKRRSLYVSDCLYQALVDRGAGYLFIFSETLLKGELLEKFENKIINFHPSLLPSFKGLNAIDQALEQNAFLLGNTAHFINEKPDSGLVIMQSIIHSSRYKTYDNVLDLQIPMLIQIMRWIKMDRLSITDEKVTVQNADYSVGPFMPKLEIEP